MKRYNYLFLTLAVALMSSCGVYKSYERPADIKTQGLYGNAESGTQSMGELGWREVFTDPTLQALIEKGLAQNSNIRQADLRIQEAQNNLKAAKLAYAPTLAFNPSGTISGSSTPTTAKSTRTNLAAAPPRPMPSPLPPAGKLTASVPSAMPRRRAKWPSRTWNTCARPYTRPSCPTSPVSTTRWP